MMRVAILTVSDKASRGEREDASGPADSRSAGVAGLEVTVVDYRIVADDEQVIAEALFHLSERSDVDLILTTGGTGLAPRDVTPQATLGAIEYEVPGIAEAMRAASLKVTPAGMLSRARGRRAARHADRQPAGQSEGSAREPGRHCRGSAARGEHAARRRRRAQPSRGWRPIFDHLMIATYASAASKRRRSRAFRGPTPCEA